MTQPELDPRPATSPISGVVRTSIGAGVLATALVAGLGISNPVLGLAALAAGTGALSGTGKAARDYLAKPDASRGRWGGLLTILAHAFAWLG
jgi:hypothetical protein